jgi:hypothetical protein
VPVGKERNLEAGCSGVTKNLGRIRPEQSFTARKIASLILLLDQLLKEKLQTRAAQWIGHLRLDDLEGVKFIVAMGTSQIASICQDNEERFLEHKELLSGATAQQ